MLGFKAVIFDLDGTLLDTLKDIAVAANTVLARGNLPTHAEDRYRQFVGSGAAELMRRALPEEQRSPSEVAPFVEAFRVEYAHNWRVHTKPYPGVADMLDALSAHQIPLAVLSNKPHDFTQLCVTEMLDRWTFSPVLGYRDDIPPKPDPTGASIIASELNLSPKDILYAGDTGIDMKTATTAGMFPVGVLWGFRPQAELEENGAKALVRTPQEIISLIERE